MSDTMKGSKVPHLYCNLLIGQEMRKVFLEKRENVGSFLREKNKSCLNNEESEECLY